MYLKALELQGFKSFPDKTVLTFGQGLTGVVGPNGSGKSNIADAVRWVLGEQSTKSLRGQKMEDVIFSGTGVRKAQGFAEVTLVLDNADGALNNPEKEVRVTRRYYRSGDSGYLINGKTVRLRDVNVLFMDTGLGRDGYSMVSQGRIEEMVSAKSENRRDMFEEAAGISHFRYRREDAIKRLNQTEDNLVRLRDIVGELKNRVGPLERQSRKAQQFLAYAAEKKELEIGVWLNTMDKAGEQIRAYAGKLDVANAQYEAAGQRLDALNDAIEQAAETVRGIHVKAETLRHENAGIEEAAAALEADAAVQKNSVGHNEEQIERLKKEKDYQSLQKRQLDHERESLNEALGRIEETVLQARQKLSELGEKLAGLKSRDREYSDKYNEMNGELAALMEEIADRQIRMSADVSASDELRLRREQIALAAEKREEADRQFCARIREQETALNDAKEQTAAVNNKLDGANLKLRRANDRQNEKKEAYENARREQLDRQTRLRFLEDTEKNMEGYQGSVKAVMREKANGRLTGIHGTVFQLLKVPEEYQTAVETALGGAIQNVVTDSDRDAKAAIELLKRTNAGRATFLPLNAVKGKPLQEKGLEDRRGFIGIASALTAYDAQYAEIVSSLLGRTVVAEDLDAAVAIAKAYAYRFRVVTLDGQVVNAGGSMTGGSKLNSAGFFRRRSDMEKLAAAVAGGETEVENARQDMNAAVTAFEAAGAVCRNLQNEAAVCRETEVRAENALRFVRSQAEENRAALNDLQTEARALQARLEGLSSRIGDAETENSSLIAKREALENGLQTLTGGRDEMRASRDALNNEMTQVNLSVAAAVQERQSKKEMLESLTRREGQLDEQSGRIDREIGELVEANRTLTEKAQASLAAAAEKRELIRRNDEAIADLNRQREEAEGASVKAREEEKQVNEEREKLSAELVRLEERKAALQKELEDTERKLFEEYNLTRREAEAETREIGPIPAAKKRLSELRGLIKQLGSVNVAAIEEYKEVNARYEFLSSQVEDVEKSKRELTKLIEELTGQMAELFLDRFRAINNHFKETFTQLFGGGSAELLLDDEKDILECGISIKAQPPGKNVKNLTLLSGGEKGLTAIALLFAILKVRPAPFCIFDEVEAALDDVNVVKYAQYVRSMSLNTQFILITHRRGTMEEADVLYGVTMPEHGVSKLLELKTAEMVEQLKLDE